MTRTLSVRTRNLGSKPSSLTEENLRAHSCPPTKQQQSTHLQQVPMQPNGHVEDEEFDLDDDENEEIVAQRRKASLQALKVYGGCFASGFLAMQEPLPWTNTSMSETTSVRTDSNASSVEHEYPKSDMDTQSIVDVQEIKTGRRRSWRAFGRNRLSMLKVSRT